jgi:hypothetical protein
VKADAQRLVGILVLASAVLAFGSAVPAACANEEDPYSLQAQALFSPSGTDLALRVVGPVRPAALEKVQVQATTA